MTTVFQFLAASHTQSTHKAHAAHRLAFAVAGHGNRGAHRRLVHCWHAWRARVTEWVGQERNERSVLARGLRLLQHKASVRLGLAFSRWRHAMDARINAQVVQAASTQIQVQELTVRASKKAKC